MRADLQHGPGSCSQGAHGDTEDITSASSAWPAIDAHGPRERGTSIAPFDSAATAGPVIREMLSGYRSRSGSQTALAECLALVAGQGDAHVLEQLARLSPPWRDHAIASIFAVLMPGSRRKRLGAYFTPPHLVDHLVRRLRGHGLDIVRQSVRDPAAGGAAFLVPLARLKVAAWRAEGVTDAEVLARLPHHLRGTEIDADLAALANALMRRMLHEEFGFAPDQLGQLTIVATGDGLAMPDRSEADAVDHEIGNPPYLRLPRALDTERQEEFDDISNGRLNLYAMFLRRALERAKPGSLVGYVIPASFLGGPEFKLFRSRVTDLAEVLVVDLIEKRSDVFLDATQDACFVVLRRRTPLAAPSVTAAQSGVLAADGAFQPRGVPSIGTEGRPWRLPGPELPNGKTLLDWGYRGAIGYLVANRQPERLHTEPGPGRYPLVWAKAVSPAGLFDFERGVEHRAAGWVDAPDTATYIVRSECIAIQRTSSRGQKRRLTAALVPKTFIDSHGGVVAENHVILLVPARADPGDAAALVAALNDAGASDRLDRVCGSASISVRLLEELELDLSDDCPPTS